MSITVTCRPTGDGIYHQHLDSPLYVKVDDVLPDGDDTYIYNSNGGVTKTSTFSINVSSIPANAIISSVKVYTRCKQISSSDGLQYPVLYNSELSVGSGTRPGTSYATTSHTFTGITRSQLTNVEIGVRTAQAYYEMRCTQIYCEITYSLSLSLPTGSGGAQIIGLELL